MNRQTIEKAALELCTTEGQEEWLKDYGKNCFMDGARWRIDSVWHDATEKPDKNQLVLFECRKTYGKGYSVNFGENYELMKRVVVGWAYIIDLIPCGKEEEK